MLPSFIGTINMIFIFTWTCGNLFQVFDCVIVFSSLCVDFYFLKGISAFTVQDFVIILAFLVPWRVIRVVNSKSFKFHLHSLPYEIVVRLTFTTDRVSK